MIQYDSIDGTGQWHCREQGDALRVTQARIVGLQSQAESSTKSQKDLEAGHPGHPSICTCDMQGELNQSQDSLRLQLEHMDEACAATWETWPQGSAFQTFLYGWSELTVLHQVV